mmetsp:Transcript_13819/g.35499  ORF Transcript_13819/g.35499 Transcript_13819/m.35499 type:complete len:255 (-) Transcript_13819:628-1392(-)
MQTSSADYCMCTFTLILTWREKTRPGAIDYMQLAMPQSMSLLCFIQSTRHSDTICMLYNTQCQHHSDIVSDKIENTPVVDLPLEVLGGCVGLEPPEAPHLDSCNCERELAGCSRHAGKDWPTQGRIGSPPRTQLPLLRSDPAGEPGIWKSSGAVAPSLGTDSCGGASSSPLSEQQLHWFLDRFRPSSRAWRLRSTAALSNISSVRSRQSCCCCSMRCSIIFFAATAMASCSDICAHSRPRASKAPCSRETCSSR